MCQSQYVFTAYFEELIISIKLYCIIYTNQTYYLFQTAFSVAIHTYMESVEGLYQIRCFQSKDSDG
jgi:hypothetical protein